MRNNTETTGKPATSFGMFRIVLTSLATVILIALAGFACSDAEGGLDTVDEPTAEDQVGGDDAHIDDTDDHVDDADTHTDDADDHGDDDGDTHTDSDMPMDDADDHGDDITEVSISMTDQLTFGPNAIVAEAGHPIRLVIENVGQALHDFTIEEISIGPVHDDGASTDTAHMDDHGDGYDLHLALDGLTDGTLEFTPEEAGVYQFRCTVLGHTEAGMVGTLTVTEG